MGYDEEWNRKRIPDGDRVPWPGDADGSRRRAAIERQNARALESIENNPEPVMSRLASWLAR